MIIKTLPSSAPGSAKALKQRAARRRARATRSGAARADGAHDKGAAVLAAPLRLVAAVHPRHSLDRLLVAHVHGARLAARRARRAIVGRREVPDIDAAVGAAGGNEGWGVRVARDGLQRAVRVEANKGRCGVGRPGLQSCLSVGCGLENAAQGYKRASVPHRQASGTHLACCVIVHAPLAHQAGRHAEAAAALHPVCDAHGAPLGMPRHGRDHEGGVVRVALRSSESVERHGKREGLCTLAHDASVHRLGSAQRVRLSLCVQITAAAQADVSNSVLYAGGGFALGTWCIHVRSVHVRAHNVTPLVVTL